MPATQVFVPVEEYLTTVCRPDCDYVDGKVLGRNMGERDHAWLETTVGAYFLRTGGN
jgi:hypothetical protein